jgi:hypothetical protein
MVHVIARPFRLHNSILVAAMAVFLGWNPDQPTAAECEIQLEDVTAETGITFRHHDGSGGRRYIVETVTAGLALFDYDGDGLIDIYFLNGAPVRGTTVDKAPENQLYRNLGSWKFQNVTAEAGVGDQGFGLGVAAADYDQDGDADLYINNFGSNVFYRNDGNGHFTNFTDPAGVAAGNKVGAGACFLDADRDGDLDLFVANYVKFSYETHVSRTTDGFPMYPGPKDFDPEPDTMYRNDGNGRFTDVSEACGIGLHAGTGMGTVCADFDKDGDTDIFVLNDVVGNFFYQNDGEGNFEEVGLFTGLAYNMHGHELGSMGVDCGDYDNDGWLDFFMTSYSGELPVLYRNLGDGYFEDTTLLTGAGAGSLPHVNWGTGFADFDNDGDRDLFVACGHLQDNIDSYSAKYSYKAPNVLLMNDGTGRFTDVSKQAGDGMSAVLSSRGAAFDDLDNDGDVDIVVLNSREAPTVLRNNTSNGDHWIEIRLHASSTNRDGIGALVKVVAGDLEQVEEVHSGRGYQSHWGRRLHFGLGSHAKIERIEVNWIGGGTQVLQNVDVDQSLDILESAANSPQADAK